MAARTVSNTGGNWNSVTTWVGGVVPLGGDTVDFTVTSGNLVVNVSTATLAGINFTNYINTITFNNNILINTSVNLGTGGYTQAGTFGLALTTATTITSNGVSWNNLLSFFGNGATYTLTDNLTVTGNIAMSGVSSITFTGNILYISGNLTVTSIATILGTTVFVFNGTGTWSNSNSGAIRNNVTINTTGILTIGANIYYSTGLLTYIAGTVDTITNNSKLNIPASTTLDTNVLNWNNVSFTAGTTTLTSDLNCQNLILNGTSNPKINLNKIYVSGNLQIDGGGSTTGTTEIVLIGTGTWSSTSTSQLLVDLTINTNGIIKLGTNVYYSGAAGAQKTLNYISGKVIAKGTTFRVGAFGPTTLINCHKIDFENVIITVGITLTMNEFFSGSPSRIVNISSVGGLAPYIIAFQDDFEKISKFVNINNCTLSKPLQLLVITNSPKSSTNTRGIRYINQSPNGIAKNKPSVNVPMAYGVGGLINDPNM